jgi:hypothetical protein
MHDTCQHSCDGASVPQLLVTYAALPQVSSLTEMALVPLLYPGLLGSLGIQPPR